jgi:hypothetical protein
VFALLIENSLGLFKRARQRRIDDYLASSSGLAELDRRMRSVEQHGHCG